MTTQLAFTCFFPPPPPVAPPPPPVVETGWTRARPTTPGVYAVVGRDGGIWLGDVRRADADWRGWWSTVPVCVVRGLERPMPPAPEWGER